MDGVPDFDLFGGEYVPPPDERLLLRISVRLSPLQKERFFALCAMRGRTPSETVRECVLGML
jgi:hypothetical protein